MKKCQNNTQLNKTNCFPEDFIKKKLSQAFVFISYIDNQINSEDYKNPITSFLNSKIVPISTSIFKTYFLEFSDLRYRSDNNLFFHSYEETQSYKLKEIKESVDLRGDNTLIKGTFNQINFIMADETIIITRIYDKISYSFAQIGGLAHIFILLSKLILYFWSKNNVLLYLISTILPNEEKDNFLEKPRNASNLELEKVEKPKTFLFSKMRGRNLKHIVKNISNSNKIDNIINVKDNLNEEGSINENKNSSSYDNINLKNELPISNSINSFQSRINEENNFPQINNFMEEKNNNKKLSKENEISQDMIEKNKYLII